MHKLGLLMVVVLGCSHTQRVRAPGAGSGDASASVLVAWTSSEGVQRLERSRHKRDFFLLANHFQSQPDRVSCGSTTLAIVLNAFFLGDPRKLKPVDGSHLDDAVMRRAESNGKDIRLPRFTPRNVFNEQTEQVKTKDAFYGGPTVDGSPDWGFQLAQLHGVIQAHGLKSVMRVVDSESSVEQVRDELRENLARDGDVVIVNYHRPTLGQQGGGHISPLGAYDATSDSVLIMDVNPTSGAWVWVPLIDMVRSMATHDTLQNRGYLLVSDR